MENIHNIDNIDNIDNKNNKEDNKNNKEDNKNDKEDNSLYKNLKIYDEQNNIYIKFVYEINYFDYKKKIFDKINQDYNLILNLFDEKICDILINIYILKKKNKISNKHFNNIEFLFTFIKKLNDTKYIDQENFLIIILNFYKINSLCLWLVSFFEEYIFKDLIDYKVLIEQVNTLFKNLSDKVLIFKVFEELNEINDENLIEEKIIYFAQKISFDLFMFYDSQKIFDEIINCFTYLDELICIDDKSLSFFKKHYSDIILKNKNLFNIFDKNKNIFIKEYDKNVLNNISIYSNEIELYIKFKVKNSENINEFIKNISYVDNV